jgi:tetratricopeptide (TPR) repeat protein
VRSFLGHVAVVAVLGVVALGLYASTVDFPFVFDDLNNIRDNPHIRAEQLTWDALWRAAAHGPTTRPVAYASFALSYRLGGLEPAAYRWGNIAIHAVCGWLVYLLSLQLLALHERLSSQAPPHSFPKMRVAAALLTAAIFVVHPLQTQSVTYIVQRMGSLSALFSLLALLCWIAGRVRVGGRRHWLWGAAFASWLLALLTKENAATLPAVVLLIEWFFLRDLDPAWLRRHAVVISAAVAVGVGLGVAYLSVYPHDWEEYGLTPTAQMLSELRVLWRYLVLVVLPLPSWQNLSHEVAVSRSLLDPPTTLVAGVGFALLFAGLVAAARRRRLVAFCGLWFFVTLAIESSFLPIELMYEHRLYLPLVGPSLLASHVLFGFRPRPEPWTVVVGMVLVALFAAGTVLRNEIWRDEATLWSDVVSKSPSDARAWNNLGQAREQSGHFEAAEKAFSEAVRLDSEYPRAYANLGIAFQRLGRIEEALDAYGVALRLEPDIASTWSNRGSAFLAIGRWVDARDDYLAALRLAPRSASAHYGAGAALARLGAWDTAEEHIEAALRLGLADADARRLLQAVRQARTLGLEAPPP